ncbi:MAG: c-type cytochrome biogenesis protein CcsB [Pseudomonadota bacterium]
MNTFCLVLTAGCYLLSAAGHIAYFCKQKRQLYRFSSALLFIGFLFQTIILVNRFFETGNFPAHNMQDALFLFAWSIAGVFVVFQIKYNLMVLGVIIAPIASLLVLSASFVPGTYVPEDHGLNSLWLALHVVAAFIGNAAFAVAFGLAVMYLIQEKQIKKKNAGFFYKRLPSLNRLDSMGYASIMIGFPMLTIGMVSGCIYAQIKWGRYWNWDPKEVWSLITWFVYAALLHERFAVGWHGRKTAIMAIVGFCAILFTFLGVNLLFSGHHAPFTRW